MSPTLAAPTKRRKPKAEPRRSKYLDDPEVVLMLRVQEGDDDADRTGDAGTAEPVGQPAGDGAVSPDEPDDDEFELIGDHDLGAADLGPLGPNAADPDAGSGRIRKITQKGGRDTGR